MTRRKSSLAYRFCGVCAAREAQFQRLRRFFERAASSFSPAPR